MARGGRGIIMPVGYILLMHITVSSFGLQDDGKENSKAPQAQGH